MWRLIWFGTLALWWVTALVGALLNATLVSAARAQREMLSPEWGWSRAIVGRSIRSGRARGAVCSIFFIAAPVVWLMFRVPRDVGATDVVQAELPFWPMVATAVMWTVAVVALVVATARDLRETRDGDDRHSPA